LNNKVFLPLLSQRNQRKLSQRKSNPHKNSQQRNLLNNFYNIKKASRILFWRLFLCHHFFA
jgi:hypothetical protein